MQRSQACSEKGNGGITYRQDLHKRNRVKRQWTKDNNFLVRKTAIWSFEVILVPCRNLPFVRNFVFIHISSEDKIPTKEDVKYHEISMVLCSAVGKSHCESYHPVHLMNADWVPGGRQPSDQINRFGLWVRRKLAATIRRHHRHLLFLLSS